MIILNALKAITIASLSLSLLGFVATAYADDNRLTPLQADAQIDPNLSDAFLMGKFSARKRSDFIKIEKRYTPRSGMYLQRQAYDAYKAMYHHARRDGINLVIRSATRSFSHQKSIWEAKWDGKRKVGNIRNIKQAIKDPTPRALKILEYSSMPGSSRHHWGTDIDLNAFNNHYFEQGQGRKTYEWLRKHASQYGFCQPYTAKGNQRPNGYNEEKWHWSFLPLSQHLTRQASIRLKDNNFKGFRGANTAPYIGVVNNYVLGIDPSCL